MHSPFVLTILGIRYIELIRGRIRKRCLTDRQKSYDRQSQSGDRYKPLNKLSSNEVTGGRFAGRFLKLPVGETTLPMWDTV